MLATAALLAEPIRSQAPKEPVAARVLVTCDGSRNCPAESAAPLQQQLAAQLAALEALVGWPLPPATLPLRVDVFGDRSAGEVGSRSLLGRELLGCGGLDRPQGRIVVLSAVEVVRVVQVPAVVWWVERLVAPADLHALGGDWLAHGLAHHLLLRAGGTCENFLVRGALFPTVRCHGGDFLKGAAAMLARDQLPSLVSLLETAGDDLDLDQHAAATSLVDWLVRTSVAPSTGAVDAQVPSPLARLVALLRAGRPAVEALPKACGADLATIERRWRDDLASALPQGARGKAAEGTTARPTHPHAAIFVYTRQPVAERHRKVVAAALAARAATLTSAFRMAEGGPVVELGPVDDNVNFWKRGRLGKPIDHAWPFVVVLEYALDDKPEAYLDCFRRAAGSRHDGGWMLDPNLDFVAHHNAQIATDQDERFGYLAIPDTPTGTHVGQTEFVHRGRVRWADGRQARLGVWTRLEMVHRPPVDNWGATHRWLVDWRVTDRSKAGGIIGCGPLLDPERTLAIWGTSRVLDFPEVPTGMRAGRGRD